MIFRYVWIQFYKDTIQQIIKKRSPRNIEFDAKGMPKWSQNRWPNSSNINAKISIEQKSWKSFELVVKTILFEDLTGCVRELKNYQTNIKNDCKIHTKMTQVEGWGQRWYLKRNPSFLRRGRSNGDQTWRSGAQQVPRGSGNGGQKRISKWETIGNRLIYDIFQ